MSSNIIRILAEVQLLFLATLHQRLGERNILQLNGMLEEEYCKLVQISQVSQKIWHMYQKWRKNHSSKLSASKHVAHLYTGPMCVGLVHATMWSYFAISAVAVSLRHPRSVKWVKKFGTCTKDEEKITQSTTSCPLRCQESYYIPSASPPTLCRVM